MFLKLGEEVEYEKKAKGVDVEEATLAQAYTRFDNDFDEGPYLSGDEDGQIRSLKKIRDNRRLAETQTFTGGMIE